MHRRKRRKVKQEGVTLNMAAMLDMAFQLLAFFIATFKPMTIEQQIALKLPPPEKVKSETETAKPNPDSPVDVLLKSMRIGLEANPDGELASILFIDDSSRAPTLDAFEAKMRAKLELASKATPIEQVILEVDPRLNLQKTMEVMDRCLRQKMADGKPLTKISPVLARTGGGQAK